MKTASMIKASQIFVCIAIGLFFCAGASAQSGTPTPTITITSVATSTATATPTQTPSPIPTVPATATPSSVATITNTPTPVFTNTIRVLRPGSVITAAPQIDVDGKVVTFTFQQFDVASLLRLARLPAKLGAAGIRAANLQVSYRTRIARMTADKSRDIQRLASKRNTLTTRRIGAGSYSATYRVRAIRNDKIVFATPRSPRTLFVVSKQ